MYAVGQLGRNRCVAAVVNPQTFRSANQLRPAALRFKTYPLRSAGPLSTHATKVATRGLKHGGRGWQNPRDVSPSFGSRQCPHLPPHITSGVRSAEFDLPSRW